MSESALLCTLSTLSADCRRSREKSENRFCSILNQRIVASNMVPLLQPTSTCSRSLPVSSAKATVSFSFIHLLTSSHSRLNLCNCSVSFSRNRLFDASPSSSLQRDSRDACKVTLDYQQLVCYILSNLFLFYNSSFVVFLSKHLLTFSIEFF